MKRGVAIACVAVAAVCDARAAAAIPLRAPQVVLNPAPLQAFLNVKDMGINVLTDQGDVPAWSVGLIGFAYPTVVLEQASGVTIGIYSTDVPNPTLVPIFNAQSTPGSYVELVLIPNHVRFYAFDANSVFLGMVDCPSIHADHFQFYVQGACGTWFGEDARNAPPAPQLLTYASIVNEPGTGYWLCFEGCAYQGGSPAPSTFTSAILSLYYIPPDDAKARSWGAVKALYR